MSVYGLKVYGPQGNNSLIVPDIASIISAGTASMPNALNDDDTYGLDIDLPGTDAILNSDIGVIVQVRDFDWKTLVSVTALSASPTHYWGSFYGNSGITYYTKNPVTTVMTAWTAGNMTPGNITTWDPVLTISFLAAWEKLGTSSTAVRIFAAISYGIYDASAASAINVYSIGTNGISEIDYIIYLKNYDGSD